MSLTMLFDRIAVAPLEDPDTTPGGIIIPETAKQKIDQGIVIYRGPLVKEIKRGMHVLFSGYAGTKLNVSGEGTFFIMPEDAVAAVVSESDDWVFTGRAIERIFDELTEDIPAADEEGRELMREAKELICGRLSSHFYSEGLMF